MKGFQHGIPGGAPPLQQAFTSQIPSLCSETEKLKIQNSQSVSRQQNMGAREHQNAFDPFLNRRPRHEEFQRPHENQFGSSKYKLKYL